MQASRAVRFVPSEADRSAAVAEFGGLDVHRAACEGSERRDRVRGSVPSGKALMAVMAALVLILAACGDDDDASGDSTVSDGVDTPQLTWGGTGSDLVGKDADALEGDCTYAGPAEVTDGVVVVEFVNTSDDKANVYVVKIDEGHTADELAEHFADPAVAAFPPWANTDMGTGGVFRAEAGETTAWEATLGAGEYGLMCTQRAVRAQPWFGSGLTVVEG